MPTVQSFSQNTFGTHRPRYLKLQGNSPVMIFSDEFSQASALENKQKIAVFSLH
jgi:hypothetical protein